MKISYLDCINSEIKTFLEFNYPKDLESEREYFVQSEKFPSLDKNISITEFENPSQTEDGSISIVKEDFSQTEDGSISINKEDFSQTENGSISIDKEDFSQTEDGSISINKEDFSQTEDGSISIVKEDFSQTEDGSISINKEDFSQTEDGSISIYKEDFSQTEDGSISIVKEDFSQTEDESISIDKEGLSQTEDESISIDKEGLSQTEDGSIVEKTNQDLSKDFNRDNIIVKIFIKKKQKSIIELIYNSILSGEFIEKGNNFSNSLDSILRLLNDSKMQKLATDIVNHEISLSILNFKNTIEYLIKTYKVFYSNVLAYFSNSKKYDLLHIDYENIKYSRHEDKEIDDLYQILELILNITYFDIFLSSDFNQVIRLLIIKNKLTLFKEEKYPITKVLNLKLDFILDKWIKRKQHSLNKKELSIIINGDSKELENFSSSSPHYVPILKNWLEKIGYHYELSENFQNQIKESVQAVKRVPVTNFFDFHSKIKYYKDIKKDYCEIKKLQLELDNINNGIAENFYNKYVKGINNNYFINNYYSSYCENVNDIDLLLKEYNNLKDELVLYTENYFLEFKLLNKVFDEILNELGQNKRKEIKYYEELIIKLDPILDLYYNKKEWIKVKNNYIYVLPFEEAQIDIKCFNIENLDSVFFFSTFVLPINAESISYDYSQVRQKFRNIKNIIQVLKTINHDLESVKGMKSDFSEKLIKLNSDLDKKDFKSIEIISLFTAIITFILSSIPAFKFINNITDAILFMLSLGGALSLFVIAIMYFTNRSVNSDYNEKNKTIGSINIGIIVILIVVLSVSVTLVSKEDPIERIIDKQYKNTKEKKVIDSLKNNFIKDLYIDMKEKD